MRFLAFILAAVAAWGTARATATLQPPAAGPDVKLTPELRARLEALKPSDPKAYFDLGEEVADTADNPATLNLARRLFVLALHLDRARSGQRLSASACLALADLAARERDRRWLQSLAGTLDQRLAGPAWVRRAEKLASSQAGYTAATALGLVRSGDGVRARQALADPAARSLLHSYERLLNAAGLSGALRTMEREADRWPCPECHNQRIVRKLGSGREPQYRLCTNCQGNPGPIMSIPELVAHLRLESQLLSGIQRSWSAQVSADRGAPLRDPDPADIAPAFDIDPAKCVFRGGQWTEPGAPQGTGAPPTPAPAPGAPDAAETEPKTPGGA